MAELDSPSFGDLLWHHRRAAELTQEELAERASLSARAISDLERGAKHRPRKDTIQLLVEALKLEDEELNAFRKAARRMGSTGTSRESAAAVLGSPPTARQIGYVSSRVGGDQEGDRGPESSTDAERVRVVLIDDHTVLRDGMRLLLSFAPDLTVVGEAGTGSEGIAVAEAAQPHVVVTDIAMPDMDGMEVTREIRKRLPETHVLVLTMHDEDSYILALIQAGASGYLLKNAAGADLIQAIRTVAEGRPWLHPHVARRLMDFAAEAAPPDGITES